MFLSRQTAQEPPTESECRAQEWLRSIAVRVLHVQKSGIRPKYKSAIHGSHHRSSSFVQLSHLRQNAKQGSRLAALSDTLFLHDLQDLHGAGLDADTAGNALGNRILRLVDHDLHGADLNALTTAHTVLLADHVNTGLGILGNGAVLAGLHALAALNTDIGLRAGTLGNDLDAAQIRVKLFIKRLRASLNALQAGHTFRIFLNSQLLHFGKISFMYNS